MLSIEVTKKCNLKCINCFAHANEEPHNHMSLNNASEILLEGRKLNYTHLSITGGEPFLWPHIFNFISYAINIGYQYIFINSNGHLLDDKICHHLSSYSANIELSITLNINKVEHDLIRGQGSYDLALEGLKTAINYNIPVSVFAVVNKRNLYKTPSFSKNIYNLLPKIKGIFFIQQIGLDTTNYYKTKDIKLQPKELIELVKIVSFLNLINIPVFMLENSLSTVVSKVLQLNSFPESPDITRKGKIVVLQNGDITFNHSSTLILKKYKKGILEEVLNSDKYIENTEKQSSICFNCTFSELCFNNEKLRPSDENHNTGNKDIEYCKKVLEELL